MIAVSTEDGRILLYLAKHTEGKACCLGTEEGVPTLTPIGQIGGDVKGRIKDFEILQDSSTQIYVVSASSNGEISIWLLGRHDLSADDRTSSRPNSEHKNWSDNSNGIANTSAESGLRPIQARQVGKVLGKYNTGHRITCLKAILMSEPKPKLSKIPKEAGEVEDEGYDEEDERSKNPNAGTSRQSISS